MSKETQLLVHAVQTNVTKEDKAALERMAAAENRSLSYVIRSLLRAATEGK